MWLFNAEIPNISLAFQFMKGHQSISCINRNLQPRRVLKNNNNYNNNKMFLVNLGDGYRQSSKFNFDNSVQKCPPPPVQKMFLFIFKEPE